MSTQYSSNQFRPVMVRAKAIGRALLQVYADDKGTPPPEFLELLDIAEKRLGEAGYLPKPPGDGRQD